MATAIAFARPASAVPRQNWILNPLQDGVFVVAAPLISLALALAAFAVLGAVEATSVILLVHVVLTVAHHMPTFIRVYGDVDLFRRFKWTFILGPVLPFCFASTVLVYLNVRGYPVENVLYLFILLTLWDPWHFLMQHYGFMRIYDRHNGAPRRLAARMDLLLCASWFVFIMFASGDWLVDVLEDLFVTARLPAALLVPAGAVAVLQGLSLAAATSAALAYGGYLLWCRRNGYFVSLAKLTLFATTFGVMFLAYTPNEWILAAAPGWSFKVGFAVLGIVHMTQYLAIVWRYNRGLAARPGRARAGVFSRLHAGRWRLAGAGYVLVCLAYGAVLTSDHDNRWLMSFLIAAGFTSTLMHYYFDGFIWKMRHRQNRENLSLNESGAPSASAPHPTKTESASSSAAVARTDSQTGGASWWDVIPRRSALAVLARQVLYFGVPMAVLTAGALQTLSGPGTNYVGHMLRGETLYRGGRLEAALEEAKVALESMDLQLPVRRRLAEMQPTAEREAALALLIYNRSKYARLLIPALEGRPADARRMRAHRASVAEAVALLEHALERPTAPRLIGADDVDLRGAARTLSSWRRELEELPISIDANAIE